MYRFIEMMDSYTSQELSEIIELCKMELRQRRQDEKAAREHEIDYSRYLKMRIRTDKQVLREQQRIKRQMRMQEEWITETIRSADVHTLLNMDEWSYRELDDLDVRQEYRLKIERCYFE